ncbi:unnamed protein product, partial [Adineta ricciae]
LDLAIPPDLIVENAILIYNEERSKWSTYSLLKRNCEHFAFICCTDQSRLSEQMLAKWDLLSGTISTVVMTGTSVLFGFLKGFLKSVVRIGEKLVPSSLTNLTITSVDEFVKASLPGNLITAGIAFIVEVVILTVRWLVHCWFYRKRKYCNGNKEECTKNKEKYEDKLASGYAIKTRIYVKCLIQAATANGAS